MSRSLTAGTHAVQVLRTYGDRSPGWGTRPGGARLPTRVLSRIRRPSYPFAPDGERSIARAYRKVFGRAQRLIYIEDQYLWSKEVANLIAEAMRSSPDLHVVAVVPRYPDQDGRFSLPPNLIGRRQAVEVCREVDADRISVFDVVNPAGTPVYVHAKVCIVDDVWATIGSDNMNRRSWTHDSELNVAVIDETRDQRDPVDLTGRGDGARVFARDLRLRLWREHLDWDDARDGDLNRLVDPAAAISELRRRADRLDEWFREGEKGERPPGRLRPHEPEQLSWFTRAWATPLYRTIYDPDGRPLGLRRAHDW